MCHGGLFKIGFGVNHQAVKSRRNIHQQSQVLVFSGGNFFCPHVPAALHLIARDTLSHFIYRIAGTYFAHHGCGIFGSIDFFLLDVYAVNNYSDSVIVI